MRTGTVVRPTGSICKKPRRLPDALHTRSSPNLERGSLSDLNLFLNGAAVRAQLTSTPLPLWRIYGPLEEPEFYLPLVARTGNPRLSIKWASALGLVHFDLQGALQELRRSLESWQETIKRDPKPAALLELWPEERRTDLRSLLRRVARRPGMYLGSNDGWALRSYLHGMADGGDWLTLPAVPELREVMKQIEEQSLGSYGSPFAAYRVYEHDILPLLSWAGIEPE